MNAKDICQFHKFGHCKFRIYCQKVHLENVCDKDGCDASCNMRHPVLCRYFALFGKCKFNPCSYRHKFINNQRIRQLEERIECEELKVKKLELIVEEKTKLLKELEIRVNAMECKTTFVTGELDKLVLFSKSKSAVTDLSIASTSSSYMPPNQDVGSFNHSFSPQCIASQQVSSIPQLDGGTCGEAENCFNGDKLCNFCDEDFTNIEDYTTHMNKHGFMCNNCLDYYTDDKPWFSHTNLTFIRDGALLKT